MERARTKEGDAVVAAILVNHLVLGKSSTQHILTHSQRPLKEEELVPREAKFVVRERKVDSADVMAEHFFFLWPSCECQIFWMSFP